MKPTDGNSRSTPLALIVDDDRTSRLTMGAALRKAGFETREAADGADAVRGFQSSRPDLILLDVMMPGMDGFETCRAIRRLPGGEYTQILMVTGLDDTESTQKAFEAGANDFVSKPINWVMLGYRGLYMLRAGRAFQELHLSRSLLSKTQEVAKLGNWQVDYHDNALAVSPEAFRIAGHTGTFELPTIESFLETAVENERDFVRESVENAVRERRSFSVNYQAITQNGSRRHLYIHGEVIHRETGAPEMMLGVVQDISRIKQAEEEIRYLVYYDNLTGLANRMLFMNRLRKTIAASKRSGSTFALLFLDIDHFKLLNDTLGHRAGDLLLKNTAQTLQQTLRGGDTVAKADPGKMAARLGGDEFVLMLVDIKLPEHAAVVARRILKAIGKPQVIDGREVSVTASIGISMFPEDGIEADSLVKNADAAMYHAKDLGRNNYQFFKESLNRAVTERFTQENDMKKALEKGEFVLYYQPQLRVEDRRIIGAEALIRWNHPEKGFIPPDRFIPIAEDCGLIVEINRWVIEAACKQNRLWRDKGMPPLRIAVNISGYRLAEQDIPFLLETSLTRQTLDGRDIEVEITENILMQDTEGVETILGRVKDLDIRIALDDFGTGYSSLSYLTSFQVDTIKIDRSFVQGCTENKKNRVLIKTIIAMGHSLGMGIVAEGIETAEHYDLLKKYGCDECQGYFFSPPVPAGEFERLVEQRTL